MRRLGIVPEVLDDVLSPQVTLLKNQVPNLELFAKGGGDGRRMRW